MAVVIGIVVLMATVTTSDNDIICIMVVMEIGTGVGTRNCLVWYSMSRYGTLGKDSDCDDKTSSNSIHIMITVGITQVIINTTATLLVVMIV